MRFFINKEHSKLSIFLLGGLIYAIGDTTASLLLNEFSYFRLLGIFILGATLYAFEMPIAFNWIEQKVSHLEKGFKRSIIKTLLAMLYFNPIWIVRHLIFIKIISFNFDSINFVLLRIAFLSFLINIPLSLIGNYTIQNKIPLKYRFIGSVIFSAFMAVYYAMSTVWFK